MPVKTENLELMVGLLVSFCLASLFSTIPVWQLIIIPGIIAGLLNKSLKRAILAGGIGILIAWSLITISGITVKNLYLIFDQFGALIIGPGFGWLIILIILLMGLIFGILGGMIGYYSKIIILEYIQAKKE